MPRRRGGGEIEGSGLEEEGERGGRGKGLGKVGERSGRGLKGERCGKGRGKMGER